MNLFNKKNIIKILSILTILISSVSLSGCFEPKAKEFSASDNELTITLTEDFEQSGSLNSTTSFTTGLSFTHKDNSVLIQIFKYNNNSFSGFNKPNLTEFSKIITKKDLIYKKEDKIVYTGEYETTNSTYAQIFFFKTNEAYYEASFKYVNSGDDRIYEWAKSIKFSQDKVYDIDESMTNTKKIYLNVTDSASMDIATSYIKLTNAENIYQKVSFTGQVYVSQMKIDKELKSSSSHQNLTSYASTSEYQNRNLVGKDYISLSGSTYIIGHGSMTVAEYRFESESYYYTITFISNNMNINELDSYADSFSYN